MNTHQVLIIRVVDTRLFSCVADSLQKCRFTSISSTDYKYTKASISCSEVIEFTVAHGVVNKEAWECLPDSSYFFQGSMHVSVHKPNTEQEIATTEQPARLLRIKKYIIQVE